ncbi:hypothetical protein B0I35DRAFT_172329 [Stachybotrys elegans]|uniref:Protein BIG1 n=1 Tax=Stachybotrys elegans TaxID=80388 RepID=A0A8K0SYR4_9HYPO|nr:hypothetical protein B0I35DRAFT_172329 [Stachybotrys elegans]
MSFVGFNLTTALIAASAYASGVIAGGSHYLRAADVLDRPFAEVMHPNMYARRQELNPINDTNNGLPLNPDSTFSVEEWNEITDEACIKALGRLVQSTNPSGLCICYNLPSLNANTGEFSADLRMYRVSEPRAGFAGVAPENVQVDVFYTGAAVKQSEQIDITGIVGDMPNLTKRQEMNSSPVPVRVFLLSGQVNPDKWSPELSMAETEALLLPVFTLTGTTPAGTQVQTNVSINEASFLTGVFADEVVMSDFASAEASIVQQREQLRNGEIAFVLPGVQILIFPVGLIITSIWLVLGLIAYGIGTFERINYAHMYKQRKSLVQKSGSGTI